MAIIQKITVQNIRSHTKRLVELSPTTTVIIGDNGSGKTSLLEAIYLALQGTSFKGSDGDVLRHDADWWRVDLEFIDNNKRTITFDPSLTSGKKKIIIDNKTSYRLTPKNKHPLVLFEPNDLQLLHGSPARRRKFIDHFISQLDPLYNSYLYKYERALRQRNNLLKNNFITPDEIFVWDVALSEYGAYIIDRRIAFIEKINSRLNETYNSIAKSNDIISTHYSNTYIGDIKQKLLNDLHIRAERDKIVGFTSVGPHRHDLIFNFNNFPALDVASRGEVRSIVLALKFLEVDIIKRITGIKPVILLDDVFSELDKNRQEQLLSGENQTIITSTHLDMNNDYFVVDLNKY